MELFSFFFVSEFRFNFFIVGTSTSPFAVVEEEVNSLTTALVDPTTGVLTRPFQGKELMDFLCKKLRTDTVVAGMRKILRPDRFPFL